MADWSELHKDLLQLIYSKLDSELYQLRFRSVCSSWRSSIPKNPEMKHPYNDVCVFNGRPIAVDVFGRAVTVGLDDLRVDLVAEAVFGRHKKKFLVESDGELLLVCKYFFDICHDSLLDDDGEGLYEGAVTVRFDVFRLDEKNKKWVELTSLGDRVLFLGEDCAFSASASDLRIGNGNCVIFRDDNVHSTELEKIFVFHLDQRRTSPFPCYSKLFWPPPEWVGLRINDN